MAWPNKKPRTSPLTSAQKKTGAQIQEPDSNKQNKHKPALEKSMKLNRIGAYFLNHKFMSLLLPILTGIVVYLILSLLHYQDPLVWLIFCWLILLTAHVLYKLNTFKRTLAKQHRYLQALNHGFNLLTTRDNATLQQEVHTSPDAPHQDDTKDLFAPTTPTTLETTATPPPATAKTTTPAFSISPSLKQDPALTMPSQASTSQTAAMHKSIRKEPIWTSPNTQKTEMKQSPLTEAEETLPSKSLASLNSLPSAPVKLFPEGLTRYQLLDLEDTQQTAPFILDNILSPLRQASPPLPPILTLSPRILEDKSGFQDIILFLKDYETLSSKIFILFAPETITNLGVYAMAIETLAACGYAVGLLMHPAEGLAFADLSDLGVRYLAFPQEAFGDLLQKNNQTRFQSYQQKAQDSDLTLMALNVSSQTTLDFISQKGPLLATTSPSTAEPEITPFKKQKGLDESPASSNALPPQLAPQNTQVLKEAAFTIGHKHTLRPIKGLSDIVDQYDNFLLDQWGVLHNGISATPAVLQTLNALKQANKKIVLISNSGKRIQDSQKRLERMGITPDLYDGIVTSGETVYEDFQTLHDPFYQKLGPRYFIFSWDDNRDIIANVNRIEVTRIEEADFVLAAGTNRGSVEAYLEDIEKALARGLPMIVSNPDFVALDPDGHLKICPGALGKAYEEMGGKVRWHGKPQMEMYRHCLRFIPNLKRTLAVGDSLDHDIKGAMNAGIDSLFIASGIHGHALGDALRQEDVQELLEYHQAYPQWLAQHFSW